jgi:hypothetical protein
MSDDDVADEELGDDDDGVDELDELVSFLIR